jgi:hypothetical protein
VLVQKAVKEGARLRRLTIVRKEMNKTLDLPVFVAEAPKAEAPKPVLALLFVLVEPKPPKPPPNAMMMWRCGEGCDEWVHQLW